MKKTFCSILAGMVVVGSAFAAAPTIEDRRALCEKHPDKYVWVDKTGACIPVNPCLSEKSEIKDAYCPRIGNIFLNERQRNMVIEKYVQKVLNTNVTNIKLVFSDPKYNSEYVGIKTSDGGYIGWNYSYSDIGESGLIFNAAMAYGYLCTAGGNDDGKAKLYCDDLDESLCRDIAEFASLLGETHVAFEKKDETGYNFIIEK